MAWFSNRVRQVVSDVRRLRWLPYAGGGEQHDPGLAPDNGSYVVAARRRALAVVLVGALGFQLALDESERERIVDLYDYVEKVLDVSTALGSGTRWRDTGGEPRLAAELAWDADWLPMFVAMVGSERPLVPIEFEDADKLFATATDPANSCEVGLYRIDGLGENEIGGLALQVKFPSARELGERGMGTQQAFAAHFERGCPRLAREGQAFLVARYADDRYGVVVDDRIGERLDVLWISSSRIEQSSADGAANRQAVRKDMFGEHLTDGQLARLERYPSPFLKTLDETSLKEMVVRQARAGGERSFALEDWEAALRSIVDRSLDPMALWGVRFERGLAARVFPALVLVLGFSFYCCVVRLNPGGNLLAEPWAVLRPQGVLTTVGALAWVAGTVAAVAAVIWSTCTYELCSYGPGAPGASAELQRGFAPGAQPTRGDVARFLVTRPGFQGVSLALVGTLLLALGWVQVWGANRRYGELERLARSDRGA